MGFMSGSLLLSMAAPPILLAQNAPSPTGSLVPTPSLVQLADGAYQFCTEPDPQDWQDSAGVCLNFVKQGTSIDGYYGYPHSDVFVCLRGELTGQWLEGQGLMINWNSDLEDTGTNTEQSGKAWDIEGRLFLDQPETIQPEEAGDDEIGWILYQQAKLNVEGLYAYPNPQMTPPNQLCSWPQ